MYRVQGLRLGFRDRVLGTGYFGCSRDKVWGFRDWV